MSKIGAFALELRESEDAEFWPAQAEKPAKSAAVLLHEKCKAAVRFYVKKSPRKSAQAPAILIAELNFFN